MQDKLSAMLSKMPKVDFADLRYEVKSGTQIKQSNQNIQQLSSSSSDGYVLRALKNGAWSHVAFNKEEQFERAVKMVLENLAVVSKFAKKKQKLAPVPVVVDEVCAQQIEKIQSVSLNEKKDLLAEYSQIPFRYPRVSLVELNYLEIIRNRFYVNTEGSKISEELATLQLTGGVFAKKDDLIQSVRLGSGGADGFQSIRNLESHFEERGKLAVDLLSADRVKAGTYNVIIDPSLTGVFIHEAFGHSSEADIVEDMPSFREKMKLGANLGSPLVNITDDATQLHQLGHYKYDDEGVAVRPVPLMKAGVLSGRLHSRLTATEFDEPYTGHCVAEDYNYAPIIRMGNIFLEPGAHSLSELFSSLGDGLYIVGPKGGQTAGENFTFGARCAYEVKGGRVGRLLRDLNISGNIFETLKNVSMVGNDLTLNKVGGCGKGQTNPRSCMGGPSTLIKNVVIGGV